MEKAGNLRARAGGHQWTSSQCIQKVEEMISKAISQQEDLWNMLLLVHSHQTPPPQEDHNNNNHNNNNNNNSPTGHEELRLDNPTKLSPHVVKALKVKLENSMDWCHLALCRLKEIITYNHSLRENVHASSSKFSTRLNVAAPSSVCSDRDQWSPFFFNEQTCATGAGQSLQDSTSLKAPGDAQGHRFLRSLPGLGRDNSDHWSYMFTESGLPANSAPIDLQAHQSSSSCPLASDIHGADHELSEPTNCRGGLRPRSCVPKRDREETGDEKDATVSVVFQELKPGDDTKKGIPDDGHRGWKKYGNKIIQNSNFCRGYYKCSMKECGAKKMVQPTNNNPSIFEVTYVGTHTCSSSTSTSRRRHRTSRSVSTATTTTAPKNTIAHLRGNPASPQDITTTPGAHATDILVQTKIARLLVKNQPTSTSSNVSSDPSPNVSSMSTELDHPMSMSDYPTSVCEDHPQSNKIELIGAGSQIIGMPGEAEAAETIRDCSPHRSPAEDVYLMDQMSLRDDGEVGFHSFQSDSLLWQDMILGSSCTRDQWSVDI